MYVTHARKSTFSTHTHLRKSMKQWNKYTHAHPRAHTPPPRAWGLTTPRAHTPPPRAWGLTGTAGPSFSICWHGSFSAPKTQRVIFRVIPRGCAFPSHRETLGNPRQARKDIHGPLNSISRSLKTRYILLTTALSVFRVQNIQRNEELTVGQPQTEARPQVERTARLPPCVHEEFCK